MRYTTRRLVATQPIAKFEGRALEIGDEFTASPVDAGYFIKHGHARAVDEEPATSEESSALVAPRGGIRRRGTPPAIR